MRLVKRAIIQLICLLIFFGSMLVAFVASPAQPDPHSPAVFGVVEALSVLTRIDGPFHAITSDVSQAVRTSTTTGRRP